MKKLSKLQMKNVFGGLAQEGGGGCCAHTSDWTQSQCGLSQQDAKNSAAGCDDWNWCCASCDKSFEDAGGGDA